MTTLYFFPLFSQSDTVLKYLQDSEKRLLRMTDLPPRLKYKLLMSPAKYELLFFIVSLMMLDNKLVYKYSRCCNSCMCMANKIKTLSLYNIIIIHLINKRVYFRLWHRRAMIQIIFKFKELVVMCHPCFFFSRQHLDITVDLLVLLAQMGLIAISSENYPKIRSEVGGILGCIY